MTQDNSVPVHVQIAMLANAKGLRLSTDTCVEESYGLWTIANKDRVILADDLYKEECLAFLKAYPNVPADLTDLIDR